MVTQVRTTQPVTLDDRDITLPVGTVGTVVEQWATGTFVVEFDLESHEIPHAYVLAARLLEEIPDKA